MLGVEGVLVEGVLVGGVDGVTEPYGLGLVVEGVLEPYGLVELEPLPLAELPPVTGAYGFGRVPELVEDE